MKIVTYSNMNLGLKIGNFVNKLLTTKEKEYITIKEESYKIEVY